LKLSNVAIILGAGNGTRMNIDKSKLLLEINGKTVIERSVDAFLDIADVDEVIVSVGVSPNPLIPSAIEGLAVTRKGTIEVGDDTLQSSIPTIFAGGDIVRGGATVILAMGDGRRAAASMHAKIQAGEI
jgi:2-C-methyl-D-erythritol 4-phosphate cytidylyltransferase